MGSPGRFGPISFETSAQYIRTFETLRERHRARYAVHDVLDLDQKLQFVGLDLAEVDFVMTFHHAFCVPADERGKLLDVLKAHEYHPLVIGGADMGKFVLEELKTEWKHTSAAGKLLYASAEVRVKEYQ